MGFGNSFLEAFQNTDVADDIAEAEAKAAAEKKARIEAEGERIARVRAAEADKAAAARNEAAYLSAKTKADQLARYRGLPTAEEAAVTAAAARRRNQAVSIYGEDSPQAKSYDVPVALPKKPTARDPVVKPAPGEAKTIYSEQAAQAAGAPQFGEILPLTSGQVRGLQGVSLRSLMAPGAGAPRPSAGTAPQTPAAPLPAGAGRTRTARPDR
jgi:hypothetical protein